jgi:hypothetical protein
VFRRQSRLQTSQRPSPSKPKIYNLTILWKSAKTALSLHLRPSSDLEKWPPVKTNWTSNTHTHAKHSHLALINLYTCKLTAENKTSPGKLIAIGRTTQSEHPQNAPASQSTSICWIGTEDIDHTFRLLLFFEWWAEYGTPVFASKHPRNDHSHPSLAGRPVKGVTTTHSTTHRTSTHYLAQVTTLGGILLGTNKLTTRRYHPNGTQNGFNSRKNRNLSKPVPNKPNSAQTNRHFALNRRIFQHE